MAIATGTITTFSLADKREQIDKKVYDVEPMETPALTMLRDGKATNRLPTWFVDTIRAAVVNATIEGDTDSQAKSKTVRASRRNVVQQFTDEFRTTDIAEQVDRSDGKKPSVEQRLKQRVAVKRDMEKAIVGNSGAVVGSDTVAPVFAGMESWLETNVDRGTGGANGGWNAGTQLAVAPTDGTLRALTEAMVKGVVQKVYDTGDGKVDVLMLPSGQKVKFDTFTGLGALTQSFQSKDAEIVVNTTIDVYRTAWGKHKTVVNRYMRPRTLLALDPEFWEFTELQSIQSYDIPTNGLSLAEGIKSAGTLKARNEKSSGVVADLL